MQVVGVGGVASRMVGQLWDNEALENAEMCIINTDVQAGPPAHLLLALVVVTYRHELRYSTT